MAREWYACSEPERPTDAYVLWHYSGCVACRFKADALVRQYEDDPHVRWVRDTVFGEPE